MSTKRGLFITLEGIEGAGKSTLASLLKEHFVSKKHEVVITAEPGGDCVGIGIRQLLLGRENNICDRAELLLFEAARAQHVETTIKPALTRGAMVICDRFADSSIAYQGYARGIDLDTIRILNDYATSGLKPDLTILLDLPVNIGLARQVEIDRVSSEKISFHEAVREGFLAIAGANDKRFTVIDAEKGISEVLRQSIEAIEKYGCFGI